MNRELSKEELKKLIISFIKDSLNKDLYNTSKINQKYKEKRFENLEIKISFGLGVQQKFLG